MLASIMLISSFTAAITTSLTLDRLSGNVRGLRDLPGVRVGTAGESESLRFLVERGIPVLPFANERAGLKAIVDGEIRVLPGTFDPYHVKMAVPTGSALPGRRPLIIQRSRVSEVRFASGTDW
jgi:hypothetical protein